MRTPLTTKAADASWAAATRDAHEWAAVNGGAPSKPMAVGGRNSHLANAPAASKSIGNYLLSKTVGEGTFGKVKLGVHLLTGERVAVKVLEKDRIVDKGDIKRVTREIQILKHIRHPNVVHLLEVIEKPKHIYLVTEHVSGGELFDFIVAHGRLQERQACFIFRQVILGVDACHAMGVAHRDLKPENLLIDEASNIKIIDFGLSNTFDSPHAMLRTACGSPCYAAPEMIAGRRYSGAKADIWSLGVCLFAMLCGYLPFEDPDTNNLYKKIMAGTYKVASFVSADARAMIRGLLTTDPNRRFGVADIYAHPWFVEHCSDELVPPLSLHPEQLPAVTQVRIEEEILKQVEGFGFSADHCVQCLQARKRNHVTATYHLLQQRRNRTVGEPPLPAESASAPTLVGDAAASAAATREGDAPADADADADAAPTPATVEAPAAHFAPQPPSASRPTDAAPPRGAFAPQPPSAPRAPGGPSPRNWIQNAVATPPKAYLVPRPPTADSAATNGARRPAPRTRPSGMASAVVRGRPSPRIDVKPLATAAAAARASEMRTYLHTAIERADADGARPQSSQGGERAAAHAAAAHERPQTAQVGRAAAVTDPGRARRIQTGRALVQVAPIDTPLGPPGAAERPATSHGAATARPASGRGSAVATRQGGSGAAPGMRVAGCGYASIYARYGPQTNSARPGSPRTGAPRVGSARRPGTASAGAGRPGSPRTRPWEPGAAAAKGGGVHSGYQGAPNMSQKLEVAPKELMGEAMRVLDAQKVGYAPAAPFLLRCERYSVAFELEVVAVDDTQTAFVVRLQRTKGDAWLFREICSRVLPALRA